MNNITLIFNEDDIRILDAALRKMPYEVVANIINNINTQIQKQLVDKPKE